MAASDNFNPMPSDDTAVDMADAHDVAMWALVMQVDPGALRRAAARVGPNVWRLWEEIRAQSGCYRPP